jgi:hypothetical protein
MEDRFNPNSQVKRGAAEFQKFYDQGHRGAALAYAAQRPADKADYMRKVRSAIPEARKILTGQGGSNVGTSPGSGPDQQDAHMRKVGERIVAPGVLAPDSQKQLEAFLRASQEDVMNGRYDGNRIFGLVDNMRFISQTEDLWEEVPNANEVMNQGPVSATGTPTPQPGGGYEGTEGLANDLMEYATRGTNVKVTSAKRDNKNPASGNRSDHHHGNKDAFAYDLSDGSQPTPGMDRVASRIVRMLGGGKNWGRKGGNFTTEREGYRYQVIYRSNVGGNHYNHVHVGVKKL